MVPIHSRQVAILMTLPNFMSLVKEHVQYDAVAYGLGTLRYSPCRVDCTIIGKGCTKVPNTVATPAPELLLREFHSDMVEEH